MSKTKSISVGFLGAASLAAIAGAAVAEDYTPITAGAVMTKMESTERVRYLAGVVEGLAYARFDADGQSASGMNCMYDWFYRNPDNLEMVHAAFNRWPEHTPGAVMGILLEKACPR